MSGPATDSSAVMSAQSHPFSFSHSVVWAVIFFVMEMLICFAVRNKIIVMCERSTPVASSFEYRNISIIFIVALCCVRIYFKCMGWLLSVF